MQALWARLEQWLRTHAPDILDSLQPGASDAQIAELEDFLGVQLPDDVKSFYRIHNGQSAYRYGFIYGREWLSLERIQDEWQVWKELLDSGTFETEEGEDIGSDAAPGVCAVWWSPHWLPLTYDGGGNHDCLDLAPTEGGTVGQIITMWHDDATRSIVAPSFRAWLQQYVEGLESGRLIYSEEYGCMVEADDL